MDRDSFIFYRSFYEAIVDLPRDIQGEVYTAIMEYGLNGITTENLKPVARSIFTLVKPQIDANNTKRSNGLNGGAPFGNSNNPNGRRGKNATDNQPITNQELTENQTNVNANVNANGNDNGNDNEEKLSKDSTKNVENSFVFFIAEFNRHRNSNYRGDKKTKGQFNARIKEGYTVDDMISALDEAMKKDFHINNGFEHLTPEFFTRSDKIQKFNNIQKNQSTVNKNAITKDGNEWTNNLINQLNNS